MRVTLVIVGTEDLRANYTQDAKIGFVVNAIYTMAYALHAMHHNLCGPKHPGLCDAMSPVNGTLFLDYLLNVSFSSYSSDLIEFDHAGDPPGRSVCIGK
jgi:metabotropic glutamate receptor 1